MDKRRLRLVIVAVIGLFLVIFLIIFASIAATNNPPKPLNSTHTIIIDNIATYDSGISQTVFAGIETSAYAAIGLNISHEASVYHGDIRTGSFKYTPDNSISFILDIPSVKLSWSVSQAIDSSGEPISDALVTCVTANDIIYSSSNACVDITSGTESDAEKNFAPIEQALPLTGFTYSVTYGNSPDKPGNYALFITYYTSTGQQDALTALESLGFTPTDYEIIYTDGTTPAS